MPLIVSPTGDNCPECKGPMASNGHKTWCSKCGYGLIPGVTK